MALYKTKLRAVGRSKGLILPKELVEELHIQVGDTLCFVEKQGEFVLSAYDPEIEAQIKSARKGISRYRNTLKALAE